SPFSGVTIADADPLQIVSVSITLDAAAKGVFSPASLAASGFVSAGGGVYTFGGTAAQATTAVRALVFNPADNRAASGATETTTFTIAVDDGVATPVSNSTTTVVSTNVNDAPTLTGASAGQAVNDNATLSPFSGVTIGDVDPSTTLSISITLDTAAKGVFTGASLTASGFVDAGGGVYTFTGSPADATTAIRALVFQPTANRVSVGATETTTFTIEVDDGVATAVTDSTTTVVSTSVNDAPTITGVSAGQTVNDNATLNPFSAVTFDDVDPSASVAVSVTLDAAAKGVFTSASLIASGFVHAGGGVYTFTGTPADATTAIRALVFDPTDNRVNPTLTETTTFTISVDDGVAAAVTDDTTTVVSTSVNDAPSITGASAGQTVNDNATISPFSAVTIGDADASQTLTISVSLDTAAKGVFTGASLTASGFVDAGGGVYTFTGTAAQATTAIRALVFDPTDNRVPVTTTETTTFTISVDDGIASAVTNSTTTVESESINDAPTISGTLAGQTVDDSATITPFANVTFTDPDPSQTLLIIVSLDTAAKGVFTGASLTASGFVDAGGGAYTFSGSAAAATAAIRQLVFNPADNRVAAGDTETTTFTVSVDDGDATASDTTTTVISTNVNDAPTITGASAGQTVNDNATLSPFSAVTIADVDPSTTVAVSVTLDDAAKGVFTSASLSASGFVHMGGGVYTFSGTAAQATTAIRALVFDPADNRVLPTQTETTTFTIGVSDGIAAEVTNSTTTVISTSVNDAPTITGAVAGQAVNDNATISPFSAVTIGDADAAQSLIVSVQLDTAAKGVFTSASLTASGFTDAGGGVYLFTGTAAQATAAIRALEFDPANNRVAVGAAETTTFTVEVDDGIAASAPDSTTTVVSTSVNDAPTISGTTAGQAVTDTTTVSPFTGVTIADVDPSTTVTVTVTLDTAAKGAFTGASLTASGFVDAGGGAYTFTGTAGDATTAIRALVFQPANNRVNPGQTETTTFSVAVNDTHTTTTDSATTVVATPVNDAPSITGATAGQAVNDNATLSPFSGVSIGDLDTNQPVTVSVSLDTAAKGVFTSASLSASGFTHAGGGVYTFTGTAAQATTAIRALVFDPTNDRVAPGDTETTTFTISVDDGFASAVTNSTSSVISVSVNDAPTITGASAGQTVNDNATLSPFAAVTIGDVDVGQTLTIVVSLDAMAKGVFTSGSLTTSGFVSNGDGTYTFVGTASQATVAIRALAFDPTDNRVSVGATETTTFTITVDDGIAAPAADADTTVVSTSVNEASTFTGASAGQAVNDNATVTPFTTFTISDTDSPDQALSVSVTLDVADKGEFTGASLTASGFVHAGGGVYTFTGTAAQATAAIQQLVFQPTANRVNPGLTETTTFTVSVNDGFDTSSNAGTTVISTSINDVTTITGAVAGQAVNDGAPLAPASVTTVSPFATVTVADADTNQEFTVTVTLDDAGKGVFTSSSVLAAGFVNSGGGVYTFTGTASAATTALRTLVYNPTNDRVAVGQTETTTFTIAVNDGLSAPVTDGGTTVVSTSINDAPLFSGAVSGQQVNESATINPFASAVIFDADPDQLITVSIALDNAAKGVFTPASLTATGFVHAGGGVYTFTGLAAEATDAIRALAFDPANNRVAIGQRETTTFTVTVNDGVAAPLTSNSTSVQSLSVNDAPVVGALAGTPGTVVRQSVVTLSATGITDADNAARFVDFYRDVNGNGTLEIGTDVLLGTVGVSVSGTASLAVNTSGMPAGNLAFFARARDALNLAGAATSGTVTITNRAPTIVALTRSIDPVVTLGNNITLTASGASDLDGTIARVEFYRDADGDNVFDPNVDTLLGQDVSAVGGYTLTVSTASFAVGQNRYFARVIDSDGAASAAATVTGRINAAPTLGAFAPSLGSVARRSTVVLSASGAADTDGTVAGVDFYRDINNNGTLEIGTDILLGTIVTPVAGAYNLTINTTGYATGTNNFLARVRDNNGGIGNLRTTSVTVTNLAPTMTTVTTPTPRVVQLGNTLTLVGNGAADLDGTVASVQFFRDADGDNILDPNVDTLLGTDASAVGGFTVAVSTLNFAVGSNRIFARSIDNEGTAGNPVTTIVTVNAAPTLGALNSNLASVNRRSNITLSATGAADSDGTVARVEFYRDTNGNGTFEAGTDTLLGNVFAATAGSYNLVVSTVGYAAGTNNFFARSVDNNGATGALRTVQVTVNNLTPTLTSVVSSVARVLQVGNTTTLTAIGAADLDGTIASVQFFRDADGDNVFDENVDTLLGTDSSPVGGFALAQSTAGFSVGTNRIYARATDNNGAFSPVVTTTFVINAAPTVAGIIVNPNPISRTATYTLTADTPVDSDGSIIRVEFFRDRGVLGVFESTADLFVGAGTFTGGVWRLTLAGSGLTAGSHTFWARVQDNNGIFSQAVSITVTAA
ncbi:MAG: hypothetical protein JNK35_03535, partial [Phycisphaerae bacterium]|nr:hypothetical protein [Phycisphaerae bacterium]